MINDINTIFLTNLDVSIPTPTLNYIAYKPTLIPQPALISGIKPSYYFDLPCSNYLLIKNVVATNKRISDSFQTSCNDERNQTVEDCVIVQSKKIAAEIIGKSGKFSKDLQLCFSIE